MSTLGTPHSDVDIDLSGLISELWKKRFFVAIITGVAGLVLFVVFSAISPEYKSSTRILIENQESVFTRTGPESAQRNPIDKEAIGSQVEVLGSDTIALKVIKKLGLAKRSEFSKNNGQSAISDILTITGLKSAKPRVSPHTSILQEFKKRLGVYAINESRVLAVEFSSTDPVLAQSVPNAMAEEYIAMQKITDFNTTEDATRWLRPEVANLRGRVKDAEAKVEEYRSSSDLVLGNNNALLATQQLSEVSTELSRLRAERSGAQARIAAVRKAVNNGSSLEAVPEVMTSQVVQRLRDRQLTLRGLMSDLSTSLLPNHPRIKALRAQIGDLDNQIGTATQNILTSLKDNVDFTRKKEAELVREVNRLKSESARVSGAAVELRALEREALAERELLESYLKRFREAASRQDGRYIPVKARIISLANLPLKSHFPKIIPFTIAGMVATFVSCIIWVLAAALFSGKAFKTMGMSHYPPNGAERIAFPAPNNSQNSTFSQHDAVLVQQQHGDATGRLFAHANLYSPALISDGVENLGSGRIIVISPGGDAGSTVGCEVARNLAAKGRRVAIVDMVPGGRCSYEMLGTTSNRGLGNVLGGDSVIANVVYNDRLSSAHIIPYGDRYSPAASTALDELAYLTDALDGNYDFLIVECGASSPDGIHCVARSDSMILIDSQSASEAQLTNLQNDLVARGYSDIAMVQGEQRTHQNNGTMAA